jgi:hypothetical protein
MSATLSLSVTEAEVEAAAADLQAAQSLVMMLEKLLLQVCKHLNGTVADALQRTRSVPDAQALLLTSCCCCRRR